jgi:hypothetical protein
MSGVAPKVNAALVPTVWNIVMANYEFPPHIKTRGYQVRIINELGPLPRAGYYLDQGTGKTFCSTVAALFKLLGGADHVICVMPPILTKGWHRWLRKIRRKTDAVPDITITDYKSPKPIRARKGEAKVSVTDLRRRIPLDGKFILMSMDIFKDDYHLIWRQMQGKRVVVLVDEATSIKNVESQNHRLMDAFVSNGDREFMALTGTPLSTPMDGYAFCKFVAPMIYRDLHQFERLHVADYDYFGKPDEWQNLELLAKNMTVNSARVLRQEALPDLPPILFDPIHYELDDKHYALYEKLAEKQILELEHGGKLDLTNESALWNALQQIVVNYDHFSGNPKNVSRAITLVEQVLEELAGKKLVIFAKYRMTNAKLAALLKPTYGAVAVYGGVTAAQQRKNLDTFIESDACRVAILQPSSAGYGVDGLQEVCCDALFLELPDIPRDFHQAVARIWRDGLKHKAHIRLAIAEGTLQYGRLLRLLDKDKLVGQVCRNFRDLRDLIFARNQPELVLPENYNPNDYQ